VSTRLSRETLSQSRDWSIWRYRPLLPVAEDSPLPPLQVGWTPLYRAELLGRGLGLDHLFIKDDGRNPTASFKDRASAVGVVKAREHGFDTVTCASTGNAASSLAGQAASVGLRAVIFVPENAPRAKVAQLLVFGARVFTIRGSYDQAYDLCTQAATQYGWYNRNTGYNPYLSEGKKTAALEIAEQLGWRAPDTVVVAVGDGCIIGGLWKGFRDLYALGLIDHLPRLIGVQAEGADPLAQAWRAGATHPHPMDAHTVADSICVGIPRDATKALRAVRESGGFFLSVSDAEILSAILTLARQAAVFAEPAGATAYAGLERMVREGKAQNHEVIVVVVTGNGLKDVDSALRVAGRSETIEPTLEAVRAAVGG